jgi:CRISPR-associated endoribonuclease Cas6
MRLELEFKVEERILPKDYRREILSFFKMSLEKYDSEIFKFFYDNAEQKDFTFATYLPIDYFESNKILLKEDRFKVFFSVENLIEGVHFYNAFVLMKNKPFIYGKEKKFTLTGIRKVQDKKINREMIIVKAKSPILIRERLEEKNKDWYYLITEEKGRSILKKNILFNLKDKFSEESLKNLEIIPIDVKKSIVDFYGAKIQGSSGTFVLRGEKKLLQHFYDSGLGSKKSSGFGYLEIV